jgi:diketogulonate reductase-like aldo/keto reductase
LDNIIKYNKAQYNNNKKMDANPIALLNDGNQMPLIGLGTMNFKNNDKHFNLNDFIMNAVKIGYTHFDINPGND